MYTIFKIRKKNRKNASASRHCRSIHEIFGTAQHQHFYLDVTFMRKCSIILKFKKENV